MINDLISRSSSNKNGISAAAFVEDLSHAELVPDPSQSSSPHKSDSSDRSRSFSLDTDQSSEKQDWMD